MEWSVDWNAVGAIGQWAGAAATLFAVYVALRLARREETIRVKVGASHAVAAYGPNMVDLVIFEAVNLSRKPVILTSMGFLTPDEKLQVYLRQLLEGRFPHKVSEWERMTVEIPTQDLAKGLIEQGSTAAATFPVFFQDSTGGRHWGKFKFDPGKWVSGETPAPTAE